MSTERIYAYHTIPQYRFKIGDYRTKTYISSLNLRNLRLSSGQKTFFRQKQNILCKTKTSRNDMNYVLTISKRKQQDLNNRKMSFLQLSNKKKNKKNDKFFRIDKKLEELTFQKWKTPCSALNKNKQSVKSIKSKSNNITNRLLAQLSERASVKQNLCKEEIKLDHHLRKLKRLKTTVNQRKNNYRLITAIDQTHTQQVDKVIERYITEAEELCDKYKLY